MNKSDLEELKVLKTVKATEFANWPSMGAKVVNDAKDSSPVGSMQDGELDEAEIRYVLAVCDHPESPSSALPRFAKISPRRAQKIRTRLLERGYLRQHKVSTGKRGREAIVLEALGPALELEKKLRGGSV